MLELLGAVRAVEPDERADSCGDSDTDADAQPDGHMDAHGDADAHAIVPRRSRSRCFALHHERPVRMIVDSVCGNCV
jgi:hypothetical protein